MGREELTEDITAWVLQYVLDNLKRYVEGAVEKDLRKVALMARLTGADAVSRRFEGKIGTLTRERLLAILTPLLAHAGIGADFVERIRGVPLDRIPLVTLLLRDVDTLSMVHLSWVTYVPELASMTGRPPVGDA